MYVPAAAPTRSIDPGALIARVRSVLLSPLVYTAVGMVIAIGGCGGDVASTTQATATPTPVDARVDAQGSATGGSASRPVLAPDRMPPQLVDFPLPTDAVFVAPPRYEFGRLIVGLNTNASDDHVAALFAAGLGTNGYEVVNAIDGGVRQWHFTKDGRQGVVNVEQNALTTVININLMFDN